MTVVDKSVTVAVATEVVGSDEPDSVPDVSVADGSPDVSVAEVSLEESVSSEETEEEEDSTVPAKGPVT